MPLADGDIKVYRAAAMTDGPTNGGRMSNSEIVSGVQQAIFPHATQAQRIAGLTQYRKVFWKNTNADDIAATFIKFFVKVFTGGQDAVVVAPATHTDIQSGMSVPRWYGCGQLDQDSGTDAMSIDVETEDADLDVFHDEDTVIIFSLDTAGNIEQFEFATIYGEPSYAGDVATLEFDTPLVNEYDSSNTFVASYFEPDDLTPVVSDPVVTSSGGTFDAAPTEFPIVGHNRGTVFQNWTANFSSPTAYTVSGDTLGSVGSGTVGADFAPNNPASGVPYFTINHLAFGGAFQSGDIITFSTIPSAMPAWYKRVIPPGAAAFSNDRARMRMEYESA